MSCCRGKRGKAADLGSELFQALCKVFDRSLGIEMDISSRDEDSDSDRDVSTWDGFSDDQIGNNMDCDEISDEDSEDDGFEDGGRSPDYGADGDPFVVDDRSSNGDDSTPPPEENIEQIYEEIEATYDLEEVQAELKDELEDLQWQW